MRSNYVDLHCHLDLYEDFLSAVHEAEAAEVFTLTVTTTPKAWPWNREVTESTRYVRAALGLHPQLVHERANEVALWEQYLPETRYVGEVGIDAGPRYYRSIELQKEIFRHVLQKCARAGNKILSVHSVRSAKTVLDLIERDFTLSDGKVILHWFTGSKSEARRAIEMGCYFSINADMLSNERGRQLLCSIPVDRLLTETDGPFTRLNERIAHPSDVRHTVELIGGLRSTNAEEIKLSITGNLKELLGFSSSQRT
jgi:TatD DNase family protein